MPGESGCSEVLFLGLTRALAQAYMDELELTLIRPCSTWNKKENRISTGFEQHTHMPLWSLLQCLEKQRWNSLAKLWTKLDIQTSSLLCAKPPQLSPLKAIFIPTWETVLGIQARWEKEEWEEGTTYPVITKSPQYFQDSQGSRDAEMPSSPPLGLSSSQ